MDENERKENGLTDESKIATPKDSIVSVTPKEEAHILPGRNEKKKYLLTAGLLLVITFFSVIEYINFYRRLSPDQRAAFFVIVFFEFVAFLSYLLWLSRDTAKTIQAAKETNELLHQHQAAARNMAFIDNLGNDFDCIAYVTVHPDKNDDTTEIIFVEDSYAKYIADWDAETSYTKRLTHTAETYVLPDDREAFLRQTRREVIFDNLRRVRTYCVDFRINLTGSIHYYQLKFTAERDDNGSIIGLVSGLRCIDEEKRREEESQRSTLITAGINSPTLPMLKLVADQLPGGVIAYKSSPEEELIFFNNFMIDCLGCEDAEDFCRYTGNSFKGIVHPDEYKLVKTTILEQQNSVDRSNDPVSFRSVGKDGTVHWLNAFSHFVHSEEYGDISYVFIQDESQAHLFEETGRVFALLSSERRRIENLMYSLRDKTYANDFFNGIHVLVVDDDELSREICSDLLKNIGAVVETADSGQTALDMITAPGHPYDLVLMDIMMPGMDGLETTKAVRRLEGDKYKYLPIVGLTADNTPNMSSVCKGAGANGCMNKPLDISLLSRILMTCMKERSVAMEQRLDDTIKQASTDPLTHVKNTTAYNGKIDDLGCRISLKSKPEFAIVMFDVNNLKLVNDSYGHDIGDMYIKNCSHIICEVFQNSPVYRIGGDEFVTVVEGHDYRYLDARLKKLEEYILAAEKVSDYPFGKASMAYGFSVYDPANDVTVADVLKRADREMYNKKRSMKDRPDYVI